jgi:hypothetical protein
MVWDGSSFELAGGCMGFVRLVKLTVVTMRLTWRVTLALGQCPLRARCTTSQAGKILTLHQHDAVLFAARRQAETTEFQTIYRQRRPMVERSFAWIVRGNRKLRYRGSTKNDWWLHQRVAPVNLRRRITLGLDHINGVWIIPATTWLAGQADPTITCAPCPAPTIPKDPPAPNTTAYPRHP